MMDVFIECALVVFASMGVLTTCWWCGAAILRLRHSVTSRALSQRTAAIQRLADSLTTDRRWRRCGDYVKHPDGAVLHVDIDGDVRIEKPCWISQYNLLIEDYSLLKLAVDTVVKTGHDADAAALSQVLDKMKQGVHDVRADR